LKVQLAEYYPNKTFEMAKKLCVERYYLIQDPRQPTTKWTASTKGFEKRHSY